MPGSGKSTVGRQLAKQLGLGFVDSDVELERRLGMPIREWFTRFGEDAFRDLEQDVIDDVTGRADTVIATGGSGRGGRLCSARWAVLRLALVSGVDRDAIGDPALAARSFAVSSATGATSAAHLPVVSPSSRASGGQTRTSPRRDSAKSHLANGRERMPSVAKVGYALTI